MKLNWLQAFSERSKRLSSEDDDSNGCGLRDKLLLGKRRKQRRCDVFGGAHRVTDEVEEGVDRVAAANCGPPKTFSGKWSDMFTNQMGMCNATRFRH